MNMRQYEKLFSKIEKIEKLLNELKGEINFVKTEEINTTDKKEKPILTVDSLKTDFDNLYLDFINKDSFVVGKFVNEKEFLYLKEFCKANNITLYSKKMSKEKIKNEIVRWFMQRKAISKRI